MSRPTNKSELLEASSENYERLKHLISDYSIEQRQKTFPEDYLNRNIRDVVMHLYHWHLLLQGWYETGRRGEIPAIPAKGYTWKTTSDLNKEIQRKYLKISLEDALKKLEVSHKQIMALIETHSNTELFEKRRYKWTGSTSLGAYLISCTSSHYDWAYKLIKRCLK